MSKKKSIKVIKTAYKLSTYGHSGFTFAYCSRLENNSVWQLSECYKCREEIINRLFNNHKLITNRARFIVHSVSKNNIEKKFEEQTNLGLKIINMMEKRHKWPLTRMFGVDPLKIEYNIYYGHGPNISNTLFRKVLIGSSRWVRSPYTLSLFILLFKAGSIGRFKGVKDYEGLVKVCESYKSPGGSSFYIVNTYKFWDILMSNFNRIFSKLPAKSNFDRSNYGTYSYSREGIYKLCTLTSTNHKVNRRFRALLEKNDMI
jgi:hypothetical protein